MTNGTARVSYTGDEFEHDIFVSYSHGISSESGRDSDLKTWTRDLVGKLKEHIGYSLENQKQPVNLWYDAKLAGNVAITDTLKQKVQKSATLLIVMTGLYLSSDWCKKEREWFENEIKRRGGGIENVFVVRAMATANEEWPDFLKDGFGETVLGYPFCDEAKGREARPFGWVRPSDSKTQRDFVDSLTNLASDMATRLDEIRKKKYPLRSTSGKTITRDLYKNTHWPVLVAPGTEEVRPSVKYIRTHLERMGCMLLPPDEIKIEKFTKQDEDNALSIALAFVQCIGVSAARPEGAQIGKVQLLNERAHQKAIPRFLWRDKNIPLNSLNYDPTYKQFVESLGDIPERNITVLVDEVIKHFKNQAPGSKTCRPITAFMEVPVEALSEFDRWKNDILADDCVLLPDSPPKQGSIEHIQKERRTRQLVFRFCNAVLIIYCIDNQLHWLANAIINNLRDITTTRRGGDNAPVPVVIDYVGEAEGLTKEMGIKRILWREGSNPNELWRQVRSMAA